MIKVGITGGIGSGKTTVCNVWQSLGAYIINADEVAKNIMTHDAEVKQTLIQAFGPASYHADGSLNRKYLAEQAFGKDRVDELNAIIHPLIPREVERLMEEAKKQGTDVVVYEAALLLQNLKPQNLDHIVLVLAGKEQRVERVRKRDDVGEQQVLDRMNNQQDFSKLKSHADIIINNDASLERLKEKARKVYDRFKQKPAN